MIRRLWAGLLAALLLLTSWTAAIAEDPYLTEEELAESFATPAAVQDPPKTGDENIFNIISPTDAVPQVIPADWNCGRYGKDLYLPVPEFSSIGEMAVLERRIFCRESFCSGSGMFF